MNRDEIERLKEEEKAHLRKVRALKQQLREAKRKGGMLDALRGLDTSELDATHAEMLDKVTRQNVTAEARFELALEALDEAEKQEAARQEMARLEAERQQAEAADLVRQMKTQMLGDAAQHVEERRSDESSETASPDAPAKTIGSPAPFEAEEHAGEPERDDETPPARSIGRLGRNRPRD